MQCTYDTGSMYGNRPACPAVATHVIIYRNGSSGPFSVHLCAQHVVTMQGRVYPGMLAVAPLS